MSALSDQLLGILLGKEAGYVNHPADRGGPTKYGITEHRARADGYQGDMRDLPLAWAKAIYRKDYWDTPGYGRIADKFPVLAAVVFDAGVNMGPKAATTLLQRLLNVLNRGATDYPDILPDGDFGDLSMYALDGFYRKRGEQGLGVLTSAYRALKAARYVEIAERNPSQEVFEYGWLSQRID